MRLGPLEIGLILVIVLIVFGVGKLPQVGGAVGKAMREFRKAKEGEDEVTESKSVKAADTSVANKKET